MADRSMFKQLWTGHHLHSKKQGKAKHLAWHDKGVKVTDSQYVPELGIKNTVRRNLERRIRVDPAEGGSSGS